MTPDDLDAIHARIDTMEQWFESLEGALEHLLMQLERRDLIDVPADPDHPNGARRGLHCHQHKNL